jgi:serine phosphatase RsbU (regulator of sigma subunit)
MTAVNAVLHADLERSRFVALLLAGIDLATRRLEYVNAGHAPGFVLDAAGSVKSMLSTSGPALGFIPNASYTPSPAVTLESGDIVVLMTDGVIEAQDDLQNFFESERALNVVRANRHEPASVIVRRLYDEVRRFSMDTPQADDITAIVCKVMDVPASPAR